MSSMIHLAKGESAEFAAAVEGLFEAPGDHRIDPHVDPQPVVCRDGVPVGRGEADATVADRHAIYLGFLDRPVLDDLATASQCDEARTVFDADGHPEVSPEILLFQ